MTLQQVVAELTPEKLRGWLEEQPEEASFEIEACHECVLGQYFTDETGLRVGVGSNIARGEDGQGRIEEEVLPQWMQRFVAEFDTRASGALKARGIKSTLKILASVAA